MKNKKSEQIIHLSWFFIILLGDDWI